MKSKMLFREYIWLVNTIWKARKISLADINSKWVRTSMSDGKDLSRTTFNRHKDAIEDIFGIFIKCDASDGYKYYIQNSHALHEDSVQSWMLSTLSVSNVISESMSLQDRILLESVHTADDYFDLLTEAMKKGVRVKVVYRKYEDAPKSYLFAPYCIKLFKPRWYVLGQFERKAEKDESPMRRTGLPKGFIEYFRMFSFDRIQEIELTDEKFEIAPDFSAEEYFQDYYGAMVIDSVKRERVVVRAFGKERFYLNDLPLHETQTIVGQGDDYVDFSVTLRPTMDFFSHLLSRSSQVKVLQPQWLADKIKQMHIDAVERYK
ncbi:MAG: WYL domain-containing protein [Bacteroidaceae bacterium]|nr:WYL domain-containing protein [Bacteroidaceae bacterium]